MRLTNNTTGFSDNISGSPINNVITLNEASSIRASFREVIVKSTAYLARVSKNSDLRIVTPTTFILSPFITFESGSNGFLVNNSRLTYNGTNLTGIGGICFAVSNDSLLVINGPVTLNGFNKSITSASSEFTITALTSNSVTVSIEALDATQGFISQSTLSGVNSIITNNGSTVYGTSVILNTLVAPLIALQPPNTPTNTYTNTFQSGLIII